MGHERQRGLSWVNVHWTSYPAGDPNTPWGCPGMHTHRDVQMLLQSILLLKTLVLSRRLNIFLKCNRPFLKEPGARRDTWNHLIPCLWDEEVRPRKTWHKCLSNHRRALELSHMVIQTSQSEFWTPRTVMILPSLCVGGLNVRSLGYIPAQLWPKGSHNSCLANLVFNGTTLMAKSQPWEDYLRCWNRWVPKARLSHAPLLTTSHSNATMYHWSQPSYAQAVDLHFSPNSFSF